MSSSFRNRVRGARPLAAVLLGTTLSPAAWTADAYFVPGVELSVEHHSDFGFRPGTDPQGGGDSVEGYVAQLSATAGLRGPRGYTEIVPRIRFQEYPDREDLQRTNEYLALRSHYASELTDFDLHADYRKEDEFHSEISDAQFDEVDPDDPVVDETGRVVLLQQTRTRVQVRPEVVHRFSDRTGVGASFLYQDVSFDSADVLRVDYSYLTADGFMVWALNPRIDLRTGAYVSRYETDDNLNQTDSAGLSFVLDYRWSSTFTLSALLDLERSEIDRPDLAGTDESTDWGLSVEGRRTGEVSEWRFNAGRTFSPSGSGVRSVVDQVRVQYDRDLSERWRFTAAARAYSTQAQGGNYRGSDHDFQRGDVAATWRLTKTWSLTGAYSYINQQYDDERGDRTDNMFMISLRYQGLRPVY